MIPLYTSICELKFSLEMRSWGPTPYGIWMAFKGNWCLNKSQISPKNLARRHFVLLPHVFSWDVEEKKSCVNRRQMELDIIHDHTGHRDLRYRNTISTVIWLRLARDGRFKSVIILPLITANSKTSLKAGNLVGEAGFIRSLCCVYCSGIIFRGGGGVREEGDGCYFSNIEL